MSNPDLLQPGATQIQTTGSMPGITPPAPATRTEPKYYFCTIPNASLFRHDGKRLVFRGGFLVTDFLYDQLYLDTEIQENGNIYIRKATQSEVRSHHMSTDPEGTITAEVESSVRAQLEQQIRKEFEQKIAEGTFVVPDRTVVDPSAAIPAATDAPPALPPAQSAPTDENKIAGTSILDRLKTLRGSGVTITEVKNDDPTNNANRPLISPVSSKDLAGGGQQSDSANKGV